jgi:hypothetical protein
VRIWPGSPLVNPTPEVTTSNLPGSITDPSASIAFISSAAFCANGWLAIALRFSAGLTYRRRWQESPPRQLPSTARHRHNCA